MSARGSRLLCERHVHRGGSKMPLQALLHDITSIYGSWVPGCHISICVTGLLGTVLSDYLICDRHTHNRSVTQRTQRGHFLHCDVVEMAPVNIVLYRRREGFGRCNKICVYKFMKKTLAAARQRSHMKLAKFVPNSPLYSPRSSSSCARSAEASGKRGVMSHS